MSNILKSSLDASNHLTTTRTLHPPPGPPRCPQPRPDLRRPRRRPGRRAAVGGARRLFGPGAVAQAAAGGHGDGGKLRGSKLQVGWDDGMGRDGWIWVNFWQFVA